MTNKVLYIYVNEPDMSEYNGGHSTSEFSLYNNYLHAANKHNENVDKNAYVDAGFDLFYPDQSGELTFTNLQSKKIDFKICAAMFDIIDDNNKKPLAYYLYPRSSISKTGLRLANNVGIIDSGYRGKLCGYFDPVSSNTSLDGKGKLVCFDFIYDVTQGQRFLQICSNDLSPFRVKIVSNINELGNTSRGSGGFGSTGI